MDYRKMIDYHKQMNADMTVACIQVPAQSAGHFGVIEADAKNRVCGFQEKPQNPKTVPGNPSSIFASMGIYLFSREVLNLELESDAHAASEHDFGKNVIPQMLKNNRKIYMHNFVDENNQPKYWRDIGTRDAYYQANMDLVRVPSAFDLYNRQWPVRTYHEQYPPIKIVSMDQQVAVNHGAIVDSLISGGCVIKGAQVIRSVLSSNVNIENDASITDSVLMEGVIVGAHAKIKNAIIDKEVVIPAHSQIGYDLELERKRFAVTTSGIVIVAKKASVKD